MKKEVKARALYAGLNKVDTDWFNCNDVMVNPNAHWSAHHLHLELPLAGAEFVDLWGNPSPLSPGCGCKRQSSMNSALATGSSR